MTSADRERERLTALGGLAALSLDALSSVAYGPEAILVVLVTAGASALRYSLPITGAIIVLLAALVFSYRQVIEAFPNGGGAYAVSKTHLGRVPSLVAAASLIVDYVLNAAVGVSAGVEALTAAFPALYGARVWLCLAVLALITAANMWGIAEAARLFMVPTIAFIAAIFLVIIVGLARAHPAVPLSHTLPQATDTVGVLLILKAFASGCSALTGVEAIANSVPQFRLPRARRAQHTEVALGVILGLMLLGLGELIRRWGALPQSGTTVLAQLTSGAIGKGVLFYVIQLITLVLLSLAANTSFGGLPVLLGLLARDNFLPHVFGLRADRRVFRYGVGFLAVAAALLLIVARGNTQALVPVFAVGVFVGFTLSQVGMVRHWYGQRGPGFRRKALINGVGAVLTFAATLIELVSKFTEGAWLVALLIPLLVLLFLSIARTYARIGAELGIGKVPPLLPKEPSLVVVPVWHLPPDGGGHLGGDVARRRRDRRDGGVHGRGRRPGRRPRRGVPRGLASLVPRGAAAHAPFRPPVARQADRPLPALGRGRRQVPPSGRADPRGGAVQVVGVDSAQPARHHPGPGDPPRHQQRGALPAAVPAGDARRAAREFSRLRGGDRSRGRLSGRDRGPGAGRDQGRYLSKSTDAGPSRHAVSVAR